MFFFFRENNLGNETSVNYMSLKLHCLTVKLGRQLYFVVIFKLVKKCAIS